MADEYVKVKWNKKAKRMQLPQHLRAFKEICQEAFGFTDEQVDALKLKYRDPEEDENETFIKIEKDKDYQIFLGCEDMKLTFIVLEIDKEEKGKKGSQSFSINKDCTINDDKLEELKSSFIANRDESVKNITQLKEELKMSLIENKDESIKTLTTIKESIIDQLKEMLQGQEKAIIDGLEERIKKLEKQSQKSTKPVQKGGVKKSSVVHEDIECSVCSDVSFSGHRYMCPKCPDYNLCQDCFENEDAHEHLLYAIKDSMNMPEEVKPKETEKSKAKATEPPQKRKNSSSSENSSYEGNRSSNSSKNKEKPQKTSVFKNKKSDSSSEEHISEDEDNSDKEVQPGKQNEPINMPELKDAGYDESKCEQVFNQLDMEFSLINILTKEEFSKLYKKEKGNLDRIKEALDL